jgi:hypothetical protein
LAVALAVAFAVALAVAVAVAFAVAVALALAFALALVSTTFFRRGVPLLFFLPFRAARGTCFPRA